MNITDVGHMTDEVSDTGRDKMELAEADEGLSAARDRARSTPTRSCEDSDLVGIERADLYPRATEHIDDMIKMIQTLIEKGHAYEVDGTVYYDVTTFPGYGKLSGNTLDQLARRPPSGGRGRPGQAPPRGLRAVEEGRPQPRAQVAEPVGRRLPGMAHRVLGDVDEAPRRPLRHPHRRQRQQVPPPRGRDRPVGGGRRPPGRLDLGARRVPADERAEDGQVREEHLSGSPTWPNRASTRSRTGCCASAPATAARWTSAGRRSRARTAGSPSSAGRMAELGARRPRSARTRPRRSTRGSGRRSPTTSTCRARSSC